MHIMKAAPCVSLSPPLEETHGPHTLGESMGNAKVTSIGDGGN